jgi:hypothetical protein
VISTILTSRYIQASRHGRQSPGPETVIARSDEGGKVLKNSQLRGGKGFEKVVTPGSIGFENRHAALPITNLGHGRDMIGWSDCVTNDSHCFAKPRVGSQPAGIISRGGLGRGSMVAALTDQFSPPHASFVP